MRSKARNRAVFLFCVSTLISEMSLKIWSFSSNVASSIYLLSKNSDSVRSIDVCEKMGFSKPSVSRAVGLLKQGGYLYTDKNGYLFLTDEGKKVAHKTYERHVVLSQFFESIGVSAETATNDACKIEHVISDETFNAVKKLFRDK